VATVYKPKGRKNYIVEWVDENGKRRRKNGSADKGVAKRLAAEVEKREFEARNGLRDPEAEGYAAHRSRPIEEHLLAWEGAMRAAGLSDKHLDQFGTRARWVIALTLGAPLVEIDTPRTALHADLPGFAARLASWVKRATLADLAVERVQRALAVLRGEGERAPGTCNHFRAAIRSFSKWCFDTHRLREDPLRGLKGYNAKEDPRHDRRTLSLDELHRLIGATERGPMMLGLSGAARALCYRLAASTGLRYSEIASITPASFDWKAPSVTIRAAYTKNGDPATLPLPGDLVSDLRPFVAKVPAGSSVWPMSRPGKGAVMIQADLKAAGIEYQDVSGQFFDFHALRCETATLADQAGISPRVVQKLMRHSTLELTGRYTRPRAVDIENATSRLPSLKPNGDRPQSMAATGTDGPPRGTTTPRVTPPASDDDPNSRKDKGLCLSGGGSVIPTSGTGATGSSSRSTPTRDTTG
jgi:integrase